MVKLDGFVDTIRGRILAQELHILLKQPNSDMKGGGKKMFLSIGGSRITLMTDADQWSGRTYILLDSNCRRGL